MDCCLCRFRLSQKGFTRDSPYISRTTTARIKALIDDTEVRLKSEFELKSAFQRYHGVGINPHRLYTRKLANAANIRSFSITVAWSVSFWDSLRTAVAKCLPSLSPKILMDARS